MARQKLITEHHTSTSVIPGARAGAEQSHHHHRVTPRADMSANASIRTATNAGWPHARAVAQFFTAARSRLTQSCAAHRVTRPAGAVATGPCQAPAKCSNVTGRRRDLAGTVAVIAVFGVRRVASVARHCAVGRSNVTAVPANVLAGSGTRASDSMPAVLSGVLKRLPSTAATMTSCTRQGPCGPR